MISNYYIKVLKRRAYGFSYELYFKLVLYNITAASLEKSDKPEDDPIAAYYLLRMTLLP